MRIENPLLALNRGTECFSLARTFRTAWVIVCIDLSLALLDIGLSPVVLRWSFFGLSMHWPSSDISLHRPFSRDCLRWLSSIPFCALGAAPDRRVCLIPESVVRQSVQPLEDFSDSLGGGENRPRFLSNIWGQVTCKMSVESSHFPDKIGEAYHSNESAVGQP